MGKKKIFNDPIYGFINFPYEIIYDLIDHKYFQRLRRIGQMGLSHYVYPGAIHTRFQHAIGATHLMIRAIDTLRSKEVDISNEEAEAVAIAILLHDIGHGPFSHGLERLIVNDTHEDISLMFMLELNEEFGGALGLAIKIFKNEYDKQFLNQLVSSQLDMDRLDYLNRDSFFTGVAEGVISYDRLILMLNVRDNKLVIEEKAIYSVEKFLISRWMMYWQVYLHKASLSAEQMMIKLLERFKEQLDEKPDYMSNAFYKLVNPVNNFDRKTFLNLFASIDDTDIIYLVKSLIDSDDRILNLLANGIINRKLFKLEMQDEPFDNKKIDDVTKFVMKKYNLDKKTVNNLVTIGKSTNQMYNTQNEEIVILANNEKLIPISRLGKNVIDEKRIIKYFFCYPK